MMKPIARQARHLACVITALCAVQATGATQSDPLAFAADQYRLETRTIQTATGSHQVSYRLYEHLPYVAKPVDLAYQSLDVWVPEAIDGTAIDATGAPMLLNIKVGGYRSVSNAKGGMPDFSAMTGQPGDQPPGQGKPPEGGKPPKDGQPGGAGMPPGQEGVAPGGGMGGDKADLALAAGYVVVTPGVRGWDNQDAKGQYVGKAPAAIVDLKAVVRYLRHNDARMPGNAEWIVSAGCSAGGALSALLGISGNSPFYTPYLKALGAADAPDNIFASACYSPIADINHADLSYEWQFGDLPVNGKKVDARQSAELKAGFGPYLASLGLKGPGDVGPLSVENYGDFALRYYLQPSATAYLAGLDEAQRKAYLAKQRWIHWQDGQASFSFADFVSHGSRMKGVPAFDDAKLSSPESQLFGDASTPANHFTLYGLRQAKGRQDVQLDPALVQRIAMMNPHYFLSQPDRGMAGHWWLRNGSRDNNNDLSVMLNLATGLTNRGKAVNAALFWDGGHCADTDPAGMVRWIGQITGYAH